MTTSSTTPPTLSLSHCFLTVDDQDKALGFYRDVLGLEVRVDADLGNMRWVTLGPAGQPDVEICLMKGSPFGSEADNQILTALMSKGVLHGLIFRSTDCDATFEHVRAAGAEVLQEPIDQPYGVRDCAFRDPAGNMVRFSQPLAG